MRPFDRRAREGACVVAIRSELPVWAAEAWRDVYPIYGREAGRATVAEYLGFDAEAHFGAHWIDLERIVWTPLRRKFSKWQNANDDSRDLAGKVQQLLLTMAVHWSIDLVHDQLGAWICMEDLRRRNTEEVSALLDKLATAMHRRVVYFGAGEDEDYRRLDEQIQIVRGAALVDCIRCRPAWPDCFAMARESTVSIGGPGQWIRFFFRAVRGESSRLLAALDEAPEPASATDFLTNRGVSALLAVARGKAPDGDEATLRYSPRLVGDIRKSLDLERAPE